MQVEYHVSEDEEHPRAILYLRQMTDTVMEAIALLESDARDEVLVGYSGSRTYFLQAKDIELVRTEGREVVGYDALKRRFVFRHPLYQLESVLGKQFVRISKSALVNIHRIGHVEAAFSGTMRLVTRCGIEDSISRSFRRSFKERLGL